MEYEELLKECCELERKIINAIAAQAAEPMTREEKMVDKYGETCTQVTAAKILSVSPTTIANMLKDHRLQAVEKHVDVRSIAAYITGRKKSKEISWCEASRKKRQLA